MSAPQKLHRPTAAAHYREVKELRRMAADMEDEFKGAMREVMELRAANEVLTLELKVARQDNTIMRLEKRCGELEARCEKHGLLT